MPSRPRTHFRRCTALVVSGLAIVGSCAETVRVTPGLQPGDRVTQLYWSDADSGVVNGRKFRLANVDAPETGGVGAAVGGAACEREREFGFAAKAWVVAATRPDAVTLTLSRVGAEDRYGRTVIDLQVDGRSLAELGVEQGVYRPWPHRGTRALAPKPDWCAAP